MEVALAGGLKWLATHRLPLAQAEKTRLKGRAVELVNEPGPIVALAPEPKVYYLIHDWEYEERDLFAGGRPRRRFAGTPEKAERLHRAGVKLTPLYTRHVE